MRKLSKYWLTITLLALLGSCNSEPTSKGQTDISESETQETKVVEASKSSELVEGEVKTASNEDAAEAFYQKLMAEYGENCFECAEEIEAKLKENPPPDLAETEVVPKQLNVVIALDSSGSMAEDTNGEPRMTAAKIAITEFVDSLPETTQVSLIAFGHKGSNSEVDKAISCKGIETVYPLAAKDSDRFQAAVDSFIPTGYTPLASTLELAEQNLATLAGDNNQNVVYLVSDGEETCDGDPVSIAQRLRNSQTQLVINVIGFDVDNNAQQQLNATAQAGGGKYFSAKDRAELQQIWQQNTKEFNRYKIGNARNRSKVNLTLTSAKNKFNLCVTKKLNKERLNITKALNMLRAQNSPNSKYIDYVRDKTAQKHKRIKSWRDKLMNDLENKRDFTIEQLERELEAIEKKYQQYQK